MARPRPRRYQPSAPHGTVFRRPQPRVQIDRGLAWYCLWTAPWAEGHVVKSLREAGFAAYAPVEALTVARCGKLIVRERPVLARYVFVGLSAACPQWAAVQPVLDGRYGWMPGVPPVARVLKSAEQIPLRVPAGALQNLANGLAASLAGVQGGSGLFATGQPVKAAHGPLEGILGSFYDSDDGRVRALFNLFGRKTLVAFAPGQLRAA